jgi:hypothetical protein
MGRLGYLRWGARQAADQQPATNTHIQVVQSPQVARLQWPRVKVQQRELALLVSLLWDALLEW